MRPWTPCNTKKYMVDQNNTRNSRLQMFSKWDRSSRSEVFLGKGVLKTCSKYAGEHPCQSVISIKLQSDFIEIAPRHRCSPVNLLHIFRTPFLKNTSVAAYSNTDVYLVKFVKFFRTPFFTEYFRWLLLQCIKNRFSST